MIHSSNIWFHACKSDPWIVGVEEKTPLIRQRRYLHISGKRTWTNWPKWGHFGHCSDLGDQSRFPLWKLRASQLALCFCGLKFNKKVKLDCPDVVATLKQAEPWTWPENVHDGDLLSVATFHGHQVSYENPSRGQGLCWFVPTILLNGNALWGLANVSFCLAVILIKCVSRSVLMPFTYPVQDQGSSSRSLCCVTCLSYLFVPANSEDHLASERFIPGLGWSAKMHQQRG